MKKYTQNVYIYLKMERSQVNPVASEDQHQTYHHCVLSEIIQGSGTFYHHQWIQLECYLGL